MAKVLTKAVFNLRKETKGAVAYGEVDSNGESVDMASAKIGTIYIRKSAFGKVKTYPELITVKVLAEEDE
jgi:hypothetical protein